ncbi:MAG: 3-deoxy-7-phosphoheptulonate synthase [Pseudomonadales bacterium]|mgnify:CR=1 FL=1|jgi:3-deoxy-7-phosphoheptulonate synthase|nr:3-deoxy-7-phosphoheptulonate synthase [Pseudomonadales bacterium]MDP7358405.1 3-deoxy-7-phosphoheptulonate synthase [Pseudomonadales bacterium]MDP7594018.1 3-deoxy-7-phosphoheptulonate synthase [Pseudomonadales bacterium]HJN53345.1 3-deoxy-7-phosphoheptulonate synthase [Pseudomonadales bacterium]|tara:strand:- start:550 stop:1659 length:1110 start_codon:yes stop_codon:yes gene_type:complete
MIVILHANTDQDSDSYRETISFLEQLPDITFKQHVVQGSEQKLTEIYLIGDTHKVDQEAVESLDAVDRVIRISQEYRILGRHRDEQRAIGFTYNGVDFNQDNLHVFAGLCAVDKPESVEMVMRELNNLGQICTRMGAYKPRTNPYSFQGHGKKCLPYVFELAGKYEIKVIAMEVTHESYIDEISECLERMGRPTGVMLQVGTRNTQNFELLKAIGRQTEYPVLFKRGYGVTLNESLNAAEYLASSGNSKVIFCLRGMHSIFGSPHRNMVDFAQVPVVKRLTRMPVCIDPSHSVGSREPSADSILDLIHAAAQGVIAGANMILVDFHPDPANALVDGPQALLMDELAPFLEDMLLCQQSYQRRREIWAQG